MYVIMKGPSERKFLCVTEYLNRVFNILGLCQNPWVKKNLEWAIERLRSHDRCRLTKQALSWQLSLQVIHNLSVISKLKKGTMQLAMLKSLCYVNTDITSSTLLHSYNGLATPRWGQKTVSKFVKWAHDLRDSYRCHKCHPKKRMV